MAVARRKLSWKRASVGSVATSLRVARSRRQWAHSFCRISSGLRCWCASRSQFVLRHATLFWHQLPGTAVACPCKKAWLWALNFPSRNSFWTLVSHASAVRSQRVSSVTPCIDSVFGPHRRFWPCAAAGVLALSWPVSNCQGTSPMNVPRGGGSWYRSPANTTFRPPNGRTAPSKVPYLATLRSRMISRQRRSNCANSSALTMLNSSMMSQRHCSVAKLNSSRRLSPLPSLLPVQFKPNAWCIVSPARASAMTAWKVTTWYWTPCCQPRVSSNKPFRIRFKVYDFPVPGPPCKTQRSGSSIATACGSISNSAATRFATTL